jgi:hypothetical protein
MAWHARLRPLRVTVAGPSSFLRNGKLILALRRNPGLDGLNHGPGTCAPGPSRERACTVDSVHNRMSRARWGPCDSGSVTLGPDCQWSSVLRSTHNSTSMVDSESRRSRPRASAASVLMPASELKRPKLLANARGQNDPLFPIPWATVKQPATNIIDPKHPTAAPIRNIRHGPRNTHYQHANALPCMHHATCNMNCMPFVIFNTCTKQSPVGSTRIRPLRR